MSLRMSSSFDNTPSESPAGGPAITTLGDRLGHGPIPQRRQGAASRRPAHFASESIPAEIEIGAALSVRPRIALPGFPMCAAPVTPVTSDPLRRRAPGRPAATPGRGEMRRMGISQSSRPGAAKAPGAIQWHLSIAQAHGYSMHCRALEVWRLWAGRGRPALRAAARDSQWPSAAGTVWIRLGTVSLPLPSRFHKLAII
jgi:hypothetical protein